MMPVFASEGDSPDVHHLGQDRYLVTWRPSFDDGRDTALVGRVYDAVSNVWGDGFVVSIRFRIQTIICMPRMATPLGYPPSPGPELATRPTSAVYESADLSAQLFGDGHVFSESANGASVQDRQVVVTDYSSEDKISLEEMGFDEDSWLDQIDTVYSPSEDATYISVRTDSYEQSDLIRLAGRFGLGAAELKSDGDVERSYASRT